MSILLASATLVALAACSPPPSEDVDRTLVIAVNGLYPGGWDQSQLSFASDNYSTQAVFDMLVRFDGDGRPTPGLGLAEEYVVADDRRSIALTLRDGVTFGDGSAVDASAVATWFNHLIASDAYSYGPQARAVGLHFEATGDLDVTITATRPLYHPEHYVLDLVRLVLGSTFVVNPVAIDDPELAAEEPLGSGPYVVAELVPDVELTLERNPDYWNPEAFPFDTIVLKQVSDPIARLNALKSGQVDATPLTPDQVEEAESSGLATFSGSATYWTLMVRNPGTSILEPLRDVRVRQAIAMSFDRETIAETLDLGYGRASSQAFIEGQAEYVEGGDARYGYDLEAARDLMAQAGYPDGFELPIPTEASTAPVEPIVEQSLADIGIRVTFVPLAADWFSASLSGEYPVTLFQMHNLNTVRLLDERFGELGAFFDADTEMTELLATIRTADREESLAASQELGRKILEELWYIPFSRPSQFWGADGEVVAIRTNDARDPRLEHFILPS